MKGLIIKDFNILFLRKQTVAIFLLVALFMAIFQGESTFVIPYLGMLMTIWAVGTLAYDENDNGLPFLYTLPVTHNTYVAEKYVFCGLAGIAGWALGLILCTAVSLAKGMPFITAEEFLITLVYLPVFLLGLDILLPVQIKFGAEKSRLALMIIVIVVVVAVIKFSDATGLSEGEIATLVGAINGLSIGTILAVAVVIAAVVTAISYLISVSFAKAKEL